MFLTLRWPWKKEFGLKKALEHTSWRSVTEIYDGRTWRYWSGPVLGPTSQKTQLKILFLDSWRSLRNHPAGLLSGNEQQYSCRSRAIQEQPIQGLACVWIVLNRHESSCCWQFSCIVPPSQDNIGLLRTRVGRTCPSSLAVISSLSYQVYTACV